MKDGYKNWMNGYGAMSYMFWVQSDQNTILGPRPPRNLNFPNYLVLI